MRNLPWRYILNYWLVRIAMAHIVAGYAWRPLVKLLGVQLGASPHGLMAGPLSLPTTLIYLTAIYFEGYHYRGNIVSGAAMVAAWGTYFVLLIVAFIAITLLLKRYFPRPRKTDICKQCGYDIRATPDRCPECGLVQSQQMQ